MYDGSCLTETATTSFGWCAREFRHPWRGPHPQARPYPPPALGMDVEAAKLVCESWFLRETSHINYILRLVQASPLQGHKKTT